MSSGRYTRTGQDGGERYDQLLGGDGNLVSELNDLSLDFGSVRVERLGAGFADFLSLTYSLNSQREERVNQGGNGATPRTHRARAGADDGARLPGQAGEAAVAARGADRRRRRLFRSASRPKPSTSTR